MPDTRRHRGRHPADTGLFAASRLPVLRRAVFELSWLLGRGYSETAALKLVGDRYELRERQRKAIARAACTDEERDRRAERRIGAGDLPGRPLAIDGLNCLITIEAALSGGVVLVARDGCYRDLASVHGSYRRVEETRPAIAAVGELLLEAGAGDALWYLDRPVSNSGRLAELVRACAREADLSWTVELLDAPDRALVADTERVVSTGDGWVLDRCGAWIDLPAAVIPRAAPEAWILDLRPAEEAPARSG